MQEDNFYIDLTDAVMEAKRKLRITQTSIYDAELEGFASDCLKQVRALSTLIISNTTLDVVQGEAVLPKGFQKIIAVRFCDTDGIGYGNYFADFAFMNQCGCEIYGGEIWGWDVGGMMINGNKIIFANPQNAPSKIKISYKSTLIDGDAYVLMPERSKLMVVYYLAHQFVSVYPKQYETWQYQEWKKEYMAKRDAVISEAARDSLTKNMAMMVSLTHPLIIQL